MTDQDDIAYLKRTVTQLRADVSEMKEEQRRRELQQWKMGVRALGVIVLAMGGWIWAQVGFLFDLGGGK